MCFYIPNSFYFDFSNASIRLLISRILFLKDLFDSTSSYAVKVSINILDVSINLDVYLIDQVEIHSNTERKIHDF
jgi:hypothetical protein